VVHFRLFATVGHYFLTFNVSSISSSTKSTPSVLAIFMTAAASTKFFGGHVAGPKPLTDLLRHRGPYVEVKTLPALTQVMISMASIMGVTSRASSQSFKSCSTDPPCPPFASGTSRLKTTSVQLCPLDVVLASAQLA